MLEPYEEAAEQDPNYYGEFLWDMDALQKTFVLVNKEGFQIHVHSIGDGATRNTLDALEYAHTQVPGEFRNAITHLQVFSPQDIPRFKELGGIASTQAGFWGFKEPTWWEGGR